jgi:hypothetical protein
MNNLYADIFTRYRKFAAAEAQGKSPMYEDLARRIANDRSILAFLSELPREKQQPNLLFAAVNYLHGTPRGWEDFRAFIEQHGDEVAGIMKTRSTQTNVPERCATLLPLMARLPQPLALLEVGASAGLCLLPDYYHYRFDSRQVQPTRHSTASPPSLACRASPGTPLPARGIEVGWRAGLDSDPIDINNDDQIAWLEALVWPGEPDRLENLRAALAVARQDPPRIIRGDLRADLAQLAAEAPREMTLVVFHTAVLAYVESLEDRAAFARTVRELRAAWISNEAAGVFPEISAKASRPGPPHHALLSLDGEPIAWTDLHGASIEWL